MTVDGNTADISVIVCCYTEKRLDDLYDVIASVKAQTIRPREIIVVVDHNIDLFQKVKGTFQDVMVIENHSDQGASGSRNSGVLAAGGEIIAFIDDDAVADPDWLAQLFSEYRNENIIGVGGEISPLWVTKWQVWFPVEFYWVIGSSYKGMPTCTAPVRNLWTVNMSVRCNAFHAIKGFRTGFGKVGKRSSPEDTDLCIRLIQKFPQGVLLYTPNAKVHHKVTPERATFRYFVWRSFNEGQGKAELSSLVGQNQGMSAERSHLLTTIPKGILREISSAIFHGDLAAFARAGAIMVGISAAILGYIWGKMKLTSWFLLSSKKRRTSST